MARRKAIQLDDATQKQPELVPLPTGSLTGRVATPTRGVPAAAAGSAVVPFIPIISALIGVADNLITTIREISVERQRTKQVQIQAEAAIEGYRQQTKQVEITQKEETARQALLYQTRLAELEAEIQQNRDQITKELTMLQMKQQHTDNNIQSLHETIRVSQKALTELHEQFLSEPDATIMQLLHTRMCAIESALQHCVTELADIIKQS